MSDQSLWRPDVVSEPHKVMIARDKLLDASRDDRVVKLKVYYPSDYDGAPLPVIMWSHGLGGSVDGAAFLSRFLASHGFVIVHVQHHGTDTSLWEGKDGHPWDIIRDTHITRETTLNRFADVPFVLSNLENWMAEHPDIGTIADLSNIGMSGHSFGALTTQVMAGMMFPNAEQVLTSFKQSVFKAGILYSPGSVEHLGDFNPADVYPPIDIPMMHMTGTDDGSPLSGQGYEDIRLAVYENTSKAEKHLMILNDGDHMVFNGSRGKLGQNPNREKHEAMIQIVALAFWEAQLKESEVAKQWLTGEGIQAYLDGEATYKYAD